ncbi:aldo/keto reductase [Natronosporangium hydrolyticum]|uniref:Aldo/keto reductase n=1 Tax=Natronosporangium hydrolyticum TaxID=2811111 RepID=A0A895YJH0_9ACTN|nr:aldo/keto reductase [Natronosporangium hydrolyticum]QSB16145.1 aldo/keto reductase [Natronosporangium hydrolyticum]
MGNENVTLAGGVTMPMVGFGTWQIRGEPAYQAVSYALAVGYRHLDTATMYGNEAEVGRAVRDSGLPREDVFLTTKLQPSDAGRERRVLDASLRALGTDYLDLWLIHAPPIEQDGVPTWREFLALRDEGLVRSIGVSNYDVDQLDLLATATGELPAVNQVPWSPARHDPYVLDEHRERAVVLEGYSPLKGTRLSDPVLREISERRGVTPAQVVLRWHLEHGIPVIPKSATPERIASNFDLWGFELSDEELSRIDAL